MKKYRVNHILYTVLQWTWGILQNLTGLILFAVLMAIDHKRKRGNYHGAFLTHWKFSFSMGLGMFIFYGHEGSKDAKEVLVHEYGHTLQSCLLGPLFLLVIGFPSCTWAFLPVFARMRTSGMKSYFDFYPESWANDWGEKVLHEPAPSRKNH